MSLQRFRLRDAETRRRPKYRCVSESLWLVIVVVIVIAATMVTLGAQIRPTPQAPPRRTPPPPKTAPQPKRESPEPEDKKPADRGSEGSAPQATPPQREPQPSAVQVSSDPNVNAGAALYRKNGCYECHVNDGQGGPQGPRLGPNPIPLPRFVAYVRNPAGDMPPFTAKVVSDDDLAKIYAFLQSRPTPPQVKDIPLLAP
jgi:mono/diheme cytochrome c family protein